MKESYVEKHTHRKEETETEARMHAQAAIVNMCLASPNEMK